METFSFLALGTKWTVSVDHDTFPEKDRQEIFAEIHNFEQRFSRFLPESEVNQFRVAQAGTYSISESFSSLLRSADELRRLSDGMYDPAVGGLLECAGYDASYRLVSDDESVRDYILPKWSIVANELTISGPVVFDFGGIGKGLCIDRASVVLTRLGYAHFFIEGGGDIYGTCRRNGDGYRVALEWPGKSDTAFGQLLLRGRGVAVSDRFKRKWQQWHHIIDPHTKKSIETIVGCTAVAPNAFLADCMTSALFLALPGRYAEIAHIFHSEWVVFYSDHSVRVSTDWSGKLFV